MFFINTQKKPIQKILSDVSERLDKVFPEKKVNLEAFLKSYREDYNLAPKCSEEWDNILHLLASNEPAGTLESNLEGNKDRIDYIVSCLSKEKSFIFLNVGSFHTSVYDDYDVLNALEERLHDSDFRFIATSCESVMTKNNSNKLLERLLDSKLGIVINTGKRLPLHFVSVVYPTDADTSYTIDLSFEEEHNEQQVLRRRDIVTNPDSIYSLYASQFKIINNRGRIANSINDYQHIEEVKPFPAETIADRANLLWLKNIDKRTSLLEEIHQKYAGQNIALSEDGKVLCAQVGFDTLWDAVTEQGRSPFKDCYLTFVPEELEDLYC